MTHTPIAVPDCLFCQIVAGKLPSHLVWESETHSAFLSIFPNTKGVTVVIPKDHHSSYLFAQTETVMCELIKAAATVAQLLDSYFADVGRTGMVFEGFGVDHLHAKLYPLHGTGNMAEWRPIESGIEKTFYPQYPGFIASNDSERAADAELAELAAAIRTSYAPKA